MKAQLRIGNEMREGRFEYVQGVTTSNPKNSIHARDLVIEAYQGWFFYPSERGSRTQSKIFNDDTDVLAHFKSIGGIIIGDDQS